MRNRHASSDLIGAAIHVESRCNHARTASVSRLELLQLAKSIDKERRYGGAT